MASDQPSTSACSGSAMAAFDKYKPPSTKLGFQSDYIYHVFLSFRGEDVRKTLVDHLFQTFSAAGLNVFLDSEKLEKGKIIGVSLESAMQRSAIRVPIFSKGYADSAWCLKEAAAMLRTPALIIPLFYQMDPTHVRYPESQSSPYKKSFMKHYGHTDRHPRSEIDGWKDALEQICSRSGWSTDITQGFEARLVKMVTNDLLKTLDRVPLEVARHPVAVDNVKNTIIQKLYLSSVEEVIKVGIWGIGGIGKTTIAKAVYNQIRDDFEAASFIFNVRTNSAEVTGLPKLQKKVLKDLSKYGEEVDSVDEGIALLRERLRRKRVLLILDDVDAIEQLDALVGDWMAVGSRVIITSKDKHILNVAQVSSECIHEMRELEAHEGLQLFSMHAFSRASPSSGFENLSERIVEACKGHPLSLEVIGSFLCDKQNHKSCWTEALHNIILNPGIQKRLFISYSALTDEEKEIFLDIACFFIGEVKTLPIIFWKSLYKMVDTAVCNLSMKLLIKINDGGIFDMHDHLRDMGRSIAEKEGTRLWKAAQLTTTSNTINFSRLQLNGDNPPRLEMLYRRGLHLRQSRHIERFNEGSPQRLETLNKPGLRYLHLQDLQIEGMPLDTLAMLPPSLIWLRLDNCCFEFGNYEGKRRPHDSRFVGRFLQMKILELNACYCFDIFLISSLFSVPNLQLQHLNLGCSYKINNLHGIIDDESQFVHFLLINSDGLDELPDTIGNLTELQYLSLRERRRLHHFPDTIGDLSQLRHLDLRGCQSLNNLPHTIGNLSELQHLDMARCRSLTDLPSTIGNLSRLQQLDMGRCSSLNNVPSTIGTLSQLKHLSFKRCEKLNKLPHSIGNLLKLQHLDLGWCGGIKNIPDTIGNLSELRYLNLRGCKRLSNLPDSIGNLSQLQHLDLQECRNLNNLTATIGNLSQLQYLDLKGCINLNNLPNAIGNLSQLQYLDLRWCRGLYCLPSTIDNLSQLHYFDVSGCKNLGSLP